MSALRTFLMVVALTSLPLGALSQSRPAAPKAGKPNAGKIYCWDTPQGRQCGDTLPADAAGARRDEFSTKTGNILNQVERSKTPEEIEAERVAQELAQHAQEERARIARDRGNLKMRYDSVDAITAEYDSRKQALSVGLGLAETSEKAAHRSLVSALDDMAGMELGGKPVNDKAFSRVSELHREWSRQLEGVRNARARIVELDIERDAQIQLWSQPDQETAPAPSLVAPPSL